MSSYKVNYSELVSALQDHKQGRANELLKKLLPNLKRYLIVVMNASEDDAQEAVHRAFLNTYEKILDDKIKNKKYIYKYLLRSCRHSYVRLQRHQERFAPSPEDNEHMQVSPAEQVNNLLDEDRQRVLEACLEQLQEDAREYIVYILKHPEVSTKSLSDYFNISESNVRVRKSRIIDDLSHCVKRKLDK